MTDKQPNIEWAIGELELMNVSTDDAYWLAADALREVRVTRAIRDALYHQVKHNIPVSRKLVNDAELAEEALDTRIAALRGDGDE